MAEPRIGDRSQEDPRRRCARAATTTKSARTLGRARILAPCALGIALVPGAGRRRSPSSSYGYATTTRPDRQRRLPDRDHLRLLQRRQVPARQLRGPEPHSR